MKKIICILLLFIFFTTNAQTWSWAKSGNGNGGSSGTKTCTDINGNILITGGYDSTITFGSYSLTTTSGSCFLTKYDSNGNVLWAKSSASSTSGQGETGYSVAADMNGNIYVTGCFNNPSVSFDSYTLTSNGLSNAFLVKYDPNGNVLWAKSGHGPSNVGYSVSTDLSGNILICGIYSYTVATFGSYTLTNNASNSIFIAKYDTNGNVLWAKTAQGTVSNYAFSVACDLVGNAYMTGHFTGPTITFGSTTLTNTGSQNIFLVKYDPNGNIIWAKSTIGSGTDNVFSINTDTTGSYITGYYTSPTITFGAITLTKTDYYNMFLAKYDNNGNTIWVKTAKGKVAGYSVTKDQKNIYLCGGFKDTLIVNNYTLTAPSSSVDAPMFILKYDLNGNVIYATTLSSGGFSQNSSITVDQSCNAYVTSGFKNNGPNFIVGTNTLNSTGPENVFLAKLSSNCQTAGVEELSATNWRFLIYPNPNNGSFNIQIDNEIKNGELILLNALGQKVYKQKISQGQNNIITNHLISGLYYCIILQDKRQVGNGKLTVE